jgi:hypothetical protein
MQPEPPEQKNHNQWVLTCLGVSVVLGVVVGQLVDFEDLGKLRLVSLTSRGPVVDLLLVVAAILLVVGGVRMTAIMRPAGLVSLGLVILVGTFAGPALVERSSPNTKMSIPFVPLTVLEFVGAALLGAGLQRIIFPSEPKSPSGGEGTKSQ